MKQLNNIFYALIVGISLITYQEAFAKPSSRQIEFISVTNEQGDVKLVPFTKLDKVREVCEVRDFSKWDRLDMSQNLYIHKLLPPQIIQLGNGISNSLDISINQLDRGVSDLVINVDGSVFSYLSALKKQTVFRNKYNVDFLSKAYLKDLEGLDFELKSQWCQIFSENCESNIRFVRNTHHPRMISEIRLSGTNTYDEVLLKTNLAKLKNMGYDSVLLRYDCSEDIQVLQDLLFTIASCDMKVYIVYVGLDCLNPEDWNPYIDPDKLKTFISVLSPRVDGMFLNWRGTSAHVKLLPIEFFNFLCNTARLYNDSIPIYGEVYYGRIGYLRKKMIVKTMPKNVNGILICNMGYYGYNHSYIVNKLFKNVIGNWDSLDKIGMVIGYNPYYATKHKVDLSFQEEYKYKKDVEDSFNSAGCDFVTMLHDGVDDFYIMDGTYDTNDNILNETKLQ